MRGGHMPLNSESLKHRFWKFWKKVVHLCRLFRARRFADQYLPLLPVVFCPIQAMLSKFWICYYRFVIKKLWNVSRSPLIFVLGNKGVKTLLESVLRSVIGPIALEETGDKKVNNGLSFRSARAVKNRGLRDQNRNICFWKLYWVIKD